MTRGDTTTSRGRREATAPEKKRGETRGGGATRDGKVEALPDGRQWHDEKLRQWKTRGNTTANQGRQEA